MEHTAQASVTVATAQDLAMAATAPVAVDLVTLATELDSATVVATTD